MSLGGPTLYKDQKLCEFGLHHTGVWKHVMPRSKEISEDLRKTVIDAHQSRKGFGAPPIHCQADSLQMERVQDHSHSTQ